MNNTPHAEAPKKLTDFKHVNLFQTDLRTKNGSLPWIFASRKRSPGASPDSPDAVVIIAVIEQAGETRLVLTREFRAPLGAFEISAPSGLVDPGENPAEAARRELREETGLELKRIIHVSPPLPSSAGLTDETVSLVYCEAAGNASQAHQTEHEAMEILLVDVDGIRRLLADRSRDFISSRLFPILLACAAANAIKF